MDFITFADELNIKGKMISITRKNGARAQSPIKSGCALRALNYVMKGDTVVLTVDNTFCFGGKGGFGFVDGPMQVPGGYGFFVSYGSDMEGAPPGMRLKKSPELAEQGTLTQPVGVMEGYTAIEIKPYEEGGAPDLVTICATPDQLSALCLLYSFRRLGDDLIFFPPGSGCSTIFRLAFAELSKERPRAVIGNSDVSSRAYFDANTLFFTLSGAAFHEMLEDADESFLTTAAWRGLKKRM